MAILESPILSCQTPENNDLVIKAYIIQWSIEIRFQFQSSFEIFSSNYFNPGKMSEFWNLEYFIFKNDFSNIRIFIPRTGSPRHWEDLTNENDFLIILRGSPAETGV